MRINNCISSPILVLSGVTKGSHLGPLLFCIFVKDLISLITYSNMLLYVDDIKVYKVIESPKDAMKLQYDLSALVNWSKQNGLSLNTKKCNIISYSRRKNLSEFVYNIDGVNLDRTREVKDLGVFFDSTPSFAGHIQYVISKSLKTLGFIKCVTSEFTDVNSILYLYKTLVLPNLTYCAQIWSPL